MKNLKTGRLAPKTSNSILESSIHQMIIFLLGGLFLFNLNSALFAQTSLCVGGTSQMTYSGSSGSWVTGNSAVATVSSGGLVTATGAGSTTVNYQTSSTTNTSLYWTFESGATNPSSGIYSYSATTTSHPSLLTGIFTQTGSGTYENFSWAPGSPSWISVQRQNPSQYQYIQFTTSGSATVSSVSFTKYHNNNSCCAGSSYQVKLQISVSGGTWTDVGAAITCNSGTQGSSHNITINSSVPTGTHRIRWVRVSGSNAGDYFGLNNVQLACSSSSANVLNTNTINVNTVPAQPSTITSPTVICANANGTYSVTNVAGVTYTWTYSGTGTITGTGNSIILNASAGGTLTVTPSNSCGNGTARTFAVSITALNAGGHNSDPLNMCDGGNPSNLTFTTAVSGGATAYAYQWQLNNASISGSTTNAYDPPALTPGTYSYNCRITDACGTVVYTTPKVITVTADPNAPSATRSPATTAVCFGTTLTITTPTYGTNNGQACGFEYGYSTDNGANWSTSSATIPSFTATGTVNKIRIRVNGGCASGCSSSSWTEYSWNVSNPAPLTTPANGNMVWRGATSTDWNTASNWFNYNGSAYSIATAVPTSTNKVIIPANQTCVLAQPSVNTVAAGVAKDVVIETGATLTMITGNLNINGNLVINGTFESGMGTVVFNSPGSISGNPTALYNVSLSSGVNFGANSSVIMGVLTINTNGWVNTNPPYYGPNSLLKYNSGGTYGRGTEWSSTSGTGYPNDVQVSNNTILDFPNTSGTYTTNRTLARDLTINAGSSLYMDYGSGAASGSLNVGRNISISGNLSLGDAFGGDLTIGGNWSHASGTFSSNNRAVFFNGTNDQTMTAAGGENFAYVVVNKSTGNVVLANNATISGGLTLTSGLIELGSNNLTLGSASVSGGSATSYVKTASTGTMSRIGAATATTFPVGNSTYNPAVLTNNGTSDIFSVRVIDNVTSNGTGVGATSALATVKRTWMISEATTGGSNASVRLYWNGASEEINGFAAASAYVAHYSNAASMWENMGGGAGADYVQSTDAITSFSPFTISSTNLFAPLPVELLSFEGQCANENVIVRWTTASEHNSLNFIVQRSEDGTTWADVQTVAAAGNSNTILDYAIEDLGAARGVKYYRLIQTDQDGVQKIYGPIQTNCGSDALSFLTFPNPSTDEFTIIFGATDIHGDVILTVSDATGKVVRNAALYIEKGTTSMMVPSLDLSPGVYQLKLTGDNFQSAIIKHSFR